MDVPFKGYQPDADPTSQGVWTNCSNVVPTLKGYKGAPAARTAGLDALAAACRGAVVVNKLDDTTRLFAGTATALYENVSGTTWTDRTRASGGAYTLSTDIKWRFAQFGNVSLAAAKSDILQSSTTGAFANVGASIPKFGVVETVGQFVFGFNASDQGALEDSADTPDRWWCCAKGDHTDWTPNIDTECATGRLTSTAGKIVGAKRFGDGIVAYKQEALYLGTYQGSPVVWDFKQLPGRVGAASHETIVDIGTPDNPRHIFMGLDDFYSFDGSRVVPLGINKLKVTVFQDMNQARAEASLAMHDRTNGLVFFYYPSADSVNPDKCVVINYRTNTWGRDDRTIEAVAEYIASGTAYDDLGTLYSTYADFPAISYDAAFSLDSFPRPAVFNTSHILQTLDAASTTSSITTGDLGDDSNQVFLSRVKPRFFTAPTSASMVNYYRQNLGDSLTTDATTDLSSSRFDVMREARWHRFRVDFVGDWEASGLVLDMEVTGSE
jgi:hypothetical protein